MFYYGRFPADGSQVSFLMRVMKMIWGRRRYISLVLRGTRDQIANIRWITEKAREFQKNIYFCFIDYPKAVDCVDHNKQWKILKDMEYQTTWPASGEICMQVRKQQLELDMGQQTVSKLEKEYIKAVYCYPDYLTYMQNTSCKMLGWMKYKLESDCREKYQ